MTIQVPKILVIDDDDRVRQCLTALLSEAGYTVVTEPNGARVEALVEGGGFDAVVTDLYMPEADGIETIGRVRRRAPELPIIGLVGEGNGDDDPCSRAMKMFGAIDVFTKPVDRDRLLTTLARAILEASH
jgi:DNA-binding NtrC family response regulator